MVICLFLRHFKIASVVLLASNAISTLFPEQAGKQVKKFLGLQQQAGPELKAPFKFVRVKKQERNSKIFSDTENSAQTFSSFKDSLNILFHLGFFHLFSNGNFLNQKSLGCV